MQISDFFKISNYVCSYEELSFDEFSERVDCRKEPSRLD